MRAARIAGERPGLRSGAGIRSTTAQAGTAAPADQRRRMMGQAAIWSGLGFVTGAIFWHAVGFWAFVSDVVLAGTAKPEAAQSRSQSVHGVPSGPPPNARHALPTIYIVDAANCTALALDRTSNLTVRRPCPEKGLALRLEPVTGREDLAVLTYPPIQAARYPAD